MKFLTAINGTREKLIEEAGQALYDFALHGSETAKHRVMELDALLGRRANLTLVTNEQQAA